MMTSQTENELEDHEKFSEANENPNPHDVEGLSLEFDEATLHGDRERAIALSPRYTTYKKLEVVTGHKINVMNFIYNIVAGAALTLSIAAVILSRTKFAITTEGIPGLFPDLTFYEFPNWFALIDSVLSFIAFTYSLVLLVLFSSVVLRQGMSKILNEQVWVIFLLVSTGAYLIPYEAAIRLKRDYQGHTTPDTSVESSVFAGIRMASFSFIHLLYLWFGVHSYRFLDRRISIRDWGFYVPKIGALLTYNLFKILVLYIHKITFSELPFGSLAGFFLLYGRLGRWPKLGIVMIVIVTSMEFVLLAWIAVDIYKTRKAMKEADYIKYRTKILGFRFFLYQQFVFNIVFVATYIIILFGLHNDIQILQFIIHADEEEGRGSYFDVQYAPFGLLLCILAFVTVEAYTNLPASVRVRNTILPWLFGEIEEKQTLLEPVMYRSTEPPSLSDEMPLNTQPNLFVMQTNIDLFNLSWFVYYHGTKKEKTLSLNFQDLKLKIIDSIYHKGTDTRVVIAEANDRIIFAFKGTSSGQNLRTDLNVIFHSLSQVVEDAHTAKEYLDGKVPPEEVGRLFRRCKIHSGFAQAYGTVKHRVRCLVQSMLTSKKRPIFMTGHSLGGALATLCSLDICLTLQVPPKEMNVSTFGSPRVGNDAFTRLYNWIIEVNWRFVAGGDMISKLPKGGYRHVGKKVMLTSSGDMLIDPNALEMLFWNSQGASIVHHRKSCYMLALKAWCESIGSELIPNFWPFPVSAEDSRKFESWGKKSSRSAATPVSGGVLSVEKKRRERARLEAFAKAIDELGGMPVEEPKSVVAIRAVQRWKRVVERGLEREFGLDVGTQGEEVV